MTGLTTEQRTSLEAQLRRAQQRGIIGKGPLGAHIEHSLAFLAALEPLIGGALDVSESGPVRLIDLGSGGGLPGLVLGAALPHAQVCLVDSSQRRADELRLAAGELELSNVTVIHGRAEELARLDGMRSVFTGVTARAFGPSAVTAECAAGFLAVGGSLVVSEPPDPAPERWPADGLAQLGMELAPSPPGFQVIRQTSPCPDKFPRRPGIPSKRPLF